MVSSVYYSGFHIQPTTDTFEHFILHISKNKRNFFFFKKTFSQVPIIGHRDLEII